MIKKQKSTTIAEWLRNCTGERIRITLGRFHGRDVVSIRNFYDNEDGEEHAGDDGITLDVRNLPELADGFKRALRQAKKLGLLKED